MPVINSYSDKDVLVLTEESPRKCINQFHQTEEFVIIIIIATTFTITYLDFHQRYIIIIITSVTIIVVIAIFIVNKIFIKYFYC